MSKLISKQIPTAVAVAIASPIAASVLYAYLLLSDRIGSAKHKKDEELVKSVARKVARGNSDD